MPSLDSYPQVLRPYVFLGVTLNYKEDSVEAIGDCPFCEREGKYYINAETGKWQCKVCNVGSDKGGGNLKTFFKLLWDRSDKATTKYEVLSKELRLLYPDSLTRWGVSKSIITGEWLVPGYDNHGHISQIYRYTKFGKDRKPSLKCMESHGILGMNLFDPKKPDVYLCEGWKDGIALWEILKSTKYSEEKGYSLTGNESTSLLATANVLAVPGANVFDESWCRIFAGKRVFLMFDNDEHKTKQGDKELVTHPGYDGMKRITERLSSSGDGLPLEVCYLKWSDNGDIFNPNLTNGHDIRDTLTEGKGLTEHNARIDNLTKIIKRVVIIPNDWIKGRSAASMKTGNLKTDIVKCEDWVTLENSWRKAMTLTPGLRGALVISCAIALSTGMGYDDQVWAMIISPPSGGKSTLCEALATNDKWTYSQSEFTGFHSGWKSSDGTDVSLVNKLKNKTFLTKEGNTVLKSVNRDKILAQARDLYDKVSRTHYGHGVSNVYDDFNFTWLMYGTPEMENLDTSELGARLITYVIADKVDLALDRQITKKKINNHFANRIEGDDEEEVVIDKEALVKARQLTGGYIEYLRSNDKQIRESIKIRRGDVTKLSQFAEFISFFRAKPSTTQNEVEGDREFSSRLGGQFSGLCECIGGVLQKKVIDDEVTRLVRKTVMDTARGRTLDIAHLLFKYRDGLNGRQIPLWTSRPQKEEMERIAFMRKLGIIVIDEPEIGSSIKAQPVFKLSNHMIELYSNVVLS